MCGFAGRGLGVADGGEGEGGEEEDGEEDFGEADRKNRMDKLARRREVFW